MTKWLRKYNKILLVFAGVILMVSFLVGPAIQQFGPNPAKRTVAYMGPNKARAVRGMELGLAAVELSAVTEFCRPFSGGQRGEILFNMVEVQDAVHWLLLTEEADRAGLVASHQDGASWVADLADQLAPRLARDQLMREVQQQPAGLASLYFQNPQMLQQFAPEQYQQLAAREQALTQEASGGMALSILQQSRQQVAGSSRLTLEQFDTAMTKMRGVMRMVVANIAAPASLSDRRAASFGRRLGDSANIDYTFIPGSRLATSVPEPTSEQLAAHFQQFREVIPGEGDFGLGYRQPPRARLAWLTLDRAAIAAAVEQAEIPADQLLARWSSQRVMYPGEFTGEMERLKADVRSQRTTDVMDQARRSVVQHVHGRTQQLQRDGAYFVLPETWEKPSLEALAQSVVSDVATGAGVTIPLPAVTVLNGPWQVRSMLDGQPGIGQSQMRQGASSVRFSDVVLSVRELVGENPLAMQVGVPNVEQPLADGLGNLYFVMVLDVRGTGSADSIDEVMEQVRADFIALKGYELLRTQTESLRATAIAQGMEAVAAQFPPEMAAPMNGEPAVALTVTRDDPMSSQPPAGYALPLGSVQFCRAVMDVARRLDPRVPAPDQPIDARTVVHEIPEGMGVAVAQIVWFTPLTQEMFRPYAGGSMLQTVVREWEDVLEPEALGNVAMSGFTAQELKERWHWVDREK